MKRAVLLLPGAALLLLAFLVDRPSDTVRGAVVLPADCPWTTESVDLPNGAPPPTCANLPRMLTFPALDAAANHATWRAFAWTAQGGNLNANVVDLQDDTPPRAEKVRHLYQDLKHPGSWHPISDETLIASRDALEAWDANPEPATAWKRERAHLRQTLEWNAWVHRHRPSMEQWRQGWMATEIEARQKRIRLTLRANDHRVRRQIRAHNLARWRTGFLAISGLLLLLAGWVLGRR